MQRLGSSTPTSAQVRSRGVVFGCLSVRDDHSTGRNAGSANPDDHCGEPVGGSWRPKKDQVALSHFAYQAAETAEAKEQDGGA